MLFHRIPVRAVIDAARGVAPWGLPTALACIAAIYLCDSFAIWKTFGWFVAPMSFRDVLAVRGATYLLAAINYNIGQGAIAYFVHKTAGVPIRRGLAAILLIMGINVLALMVLATVGTVAAADVPHAVAIVLAVAYAGLALYAVALATRPRWLVSRPLFDVLLGAGIRGHLRALLVRLPHTAAVVIFQIVMFRAFHVAVPIVSAAAVLPVVFLVSVLPISIQGLGTTQAAMVYFFARYAAGNPEAQAASVLAASLVGQTLALAFQALLGVACLRTKVGRAVASGPMSPPASMGPVR